MTTNASLPLVVLIESDGSQHRHADMMSRAGFRVVSLPARDAKVSDVLDQRPRVVAAELSPANPTHTWEFVRGLRQDSNARAIPCIVYGHSLDAHDIETAARAGALWLELAPPDGARLLAAARGLVAGARKQASA